MQLNQYFYVWSDYFRCCTEQFVVYSLTKVTIEAVKKTTTPSRRRWTGCETIRCIQERSENPKLSYRAAKRLTVMIKICFFVIILYLCMAL